MKSSIKSIFLIKTTMLLCLLIVNINYAMGLTIDFARINFDMASNNPSPNSNWGEIDLDFTGSSNFQYFNLEVNGVWQIQNAPILSIEGAGNSQSLNFNFNLGDLPTSGPDNITYKASLTDNTLSGLLGTVMTNTLTTRNVTVGGDDIDTGGFIGAMPPLPLLVPLIGLLPIDWAFNSGMINQDVGIDECTPGAFSNSLKWLDAKYNIITIPDNKKSVEDLKGPLRWSEPRKDAAGNKIPNTGGTPHDAWEGKKEALKDYVTTKYFTPDKIDDVIKEMKHGEDIELDGKGHYAVISGIIKHANNKYTLYVTHDTDQGNAGGTKTQSIMFDPAKNEFLSSAFGYPVGRGIDGFVSESPVPEPATMLLLGSGLIGLVGARRKFKK